jgi:polyhydroxyalkanoate synthesis regulator phasin
MSNKDVDDLKKQVEELKAVYHNIKRKIVVYTAEINDKNQKITDIRSELPTLPKSRKTAKTGELERLEQRVRQLEVYVTQETGKETNVRQLLYEALRTLRVHLRVHSSPGQAAAAAPPDDDDSDDDSGAGVGSRRSSPRSSSRDASVVGPAVPAGAMAVAVPASAQRGSPSPKPTKGNGCWGWLCKKRHGSPSKTGGGRKYKSKRFKTNRTYKKRRTSRK